MFERNGVTGTSEIRELAAAGIRCQWRKSGILAGIEKVRAGFELEMLCLRPNLENAAMQCCHYPDAGTGDDGFIGIGSFAAAETEITAFTVLIDDL